MSKSFWTTIGWGIGLMYLTIGIRYWDIVSKDWKGVLCIGVGITILTLLHFNHVKYIKGYITPKPTKNSEVKR